MTRPLRLLVALSAAAGLVVVLGFGLSRDPRVLPVALLDEPATVARLPRLAAPGRMRVPVRGRPTLINFWASWCPPCRREFPLLRAAWRRWGREVAFVGIIYRDTRSAATKFLVERGDPPQGAYPNVFDPGSRTAIDYGLYGIPETFFIDERGVIRAKVVGELSWDKLARNMQVILR